VILAAVSPPKNEVTPCFTLANEGIVWLVQYRLVAKNANRLGRHDRFTHFWLTVDLLIYSDPLITSYYHTIPTFDPYVQMRLHHWSRLFKWAFHGILTVHLGVDGRNVRFKDTDSVGLLTSNFKNQSRPGYPRFMYIINYNFIYIYIYISVCACANIQVQRIPAPSAKIQLSVCLSKLWSTYGVLFPGELLMKFIPLGPARAEEPSLGRVANSLADRCL